MGSADNMKTDDIFLHFTSQPVPGRTYLASFPERGGERKGERVGGRKRERGEKERRERERKKELEHDIRCDEFTMSIFLKARRQWILGNGLSF